jgi:hypothetical protein
LWNPGRGVVLSGEKRPKKLDCTIGTVALEDGEQVLHYQFVLACFARVLMVLLGLVESGRGVVLSGEDCPKKLDHTIGTVALEDGEQVLLCQFVLALYVLASI